MPPISILGKLIPPPFTSSKTSSGCSRGICSRLIPLLERQQQQCRKYSTPPLSLMQSSSSSSTKYCHRYFATSRWYNDTFLVDRNMSRYAAVDHGDAYEAAMRGWHGQQLELAKLEGKGKDDRPFDPFFEMEKRKKADTGKNADANINNNMKGAAPSSSSASEGLNRQENDDNDGDDEEPEDMVKPNIYNNDGSLRRTDSQLATLRAGYPAGGMFAIVHVNGFQHKVTEHDILVVDRLKPLDRWRVGSTHSLTEVLLVSSTHLTLVGMPLVVGAQVNVMVEEITRDAKVIVFKKRRRKNSKRKHGFRRDVTVLRILNIKMPEQYQNHHHVEPIPLDLKPILLEEDESEVDADAA